MKNKMFALVISLLVYLLWIGIIYAALAVFEWKLSPEYWNEGCRCILSFVGVFFGIICGGAIFYNINSKT